jgi:Proprotein convertase P-domain/Bacterial pre-peptidase C-terminal domain/Carboxypeptidase regulatory-like domain
MKSAMIKGAKAAVLMLLLPCAAMAAQPSGTKPNPGRPQIGQPVSAHNIAVDLRNLPKAKPWTPGMGIREAHRRQYTPIGSKLPHAPADKPTARDRLPELQMLWDKSPRARSLKGNVAARSRVSINNPNTGVSPGDPVVEVGANHVIYAVNSGGSGTYFNVYNKTGTLVSGPTTFGSLAPSGNSCTSDRGDPLVHYDRQAGRWFMLTMDDTGLCTFVSKTSDPVSGGWWFYRYTTPVLPDYPHCGVWNDAYVCGTNEGSQAGTEIYAFDRANMLNGATARAAQRFNSVANLAGYGFQIMTPSTFYGTTAPPAGRRQILARHNDDEAHAGGSANGTQDFIDLYELNIDWNTPANSSIVTLPRVAITEFNSWFRDYSTFATVPQPGSTSRLDPIREVLLNQLVYRNMGTHEALVGTLATNQDPARSGTVVDSGVRWFELRRVGSGNWTLHQEGTFSPGDTSTHHLMGTIAMDKFGNIGMGYNVTKTTAPTKFASLGYTGRLASDPAGVMSLGENEVAAGAAVETSGRWGDYYQMTVDPVDDCTFWFVGMYRPSGSWQTRIADFKFPACTGGTTTYSVSGTIATSGGAGISGVSVSNGSTSVTTNASGQYTFANLSNGSYTLTPSLSGYTFSPTSLAVTVSGANVSGQNFTGTATSGGTTLTKGVPVTGLGATTGNSLNYTMVVPAGATNLTFTMSGGTGDADMYVKFGSAPTDTVYDCRPYLGGNAETCTFAAPQAGTYHIRLKAYSTFSGVSLVGDYGTGGGGTQTYTNGTDFTINDNATVESPITVSGRSGNAPSNTPVAVNIVHTYKGDLKVDLVAPDGSVYVLHNRTGGSTDNIIQTYTVNLSSEPLNGTWKLRVNDNAGGDTGRIDTWSITF